MPILAIPYANIFFPVKASMWKSRINRIACSGEKSFLQLCKKYNLSATKALRSFSFQVLFCVGMENLCKFRKTSLSIRKGAIFFHLWNISATLDAKHYFLNQIFKRLHFKNIFASLDVWDWHHSCLFFINIAQLCRNDAWINIY